MPVFCSFSLCLSSFKIVISNKKVYAKMNRNEVCDYYCFIFYIVDLPHSYVYALLCVIICINYVLCFKWKCNAINLDVFVCVCLCFVFVWGNQFTNHIETLITIGINWFVIETIVFNWYGFGNRTNRL